MLIGNKREDVFMKDQRKSAAAPAVRKNGTGALTPRVYAGSRTLFGAVRASDLLFAVCFIVTAALLFISVRYGIQSADEGFDTDPHRQILKQG